MSHTTLSWVRLAIVGISAIAAIVVGVSRITIVQQPVRVQTKYVGTPKATRSGNGYISEDQCHALAAHPPSSYSQLIATYGVPENSDPNNTTVVIFYLKADSYRSCTFGFWNGADKPPRSISLDLR